MNRFKVIAAVGLISATVFTGANTASASTATHANNTPVRADRLADTAVPRGARDQGAYRATSPVDFEVVMSPSNPAGEMALIQDEYDPSSPLYHHWLTPSQFNAEFGPSAATVTATDAWLQGKGLHTKRTSEFAISVSAPSSQVAQALGVSFESYQFQGRTGYAPRSAPLVPADVLSQLDGVLGLNTMKLPQHHYSTTIPSKVSRAPAAAHPNYTGTTCPGASQYASQNGAETMLTEAQDYHVDSLWGAGLQGGGQNVAVYELAAYQSSDTSAFKYCFGLNNSITPISLGSPSVDPNGGTSEADLDIEEIAQQAPSASILVYQTDQNGNDPYDLWGQMVGDDKAQVISSSWGECEPDDVGSSYESSVNSLMRQATLQGQTVLSASGDAGSEDCAYDYVFATNNNITPPAYWNQASIDFPGASPWVTSVGGTEFANQPENNFPPNSGPVSTAVTSANLYSWNFCDGAPANTYQDAGSPCEQGQNAGYGAGGGGVSSFEPSPSWQKALFTTYGYSGTTGCSGVCREVPDVSGNAGYPMVDYANGGWEAGYGTSYAAPFMAGVVADRNSGCQTSTGNFGALVYGLASTLPGYEAAFVDVNQGDNDMLNHYNGTEYRAGPGFDRATGLGTPIPSAIACPEISSATQAAAPVSSVAAGSSVTLNGIGLEDASIYFGPALATVTASTATSITVTVPQVNAFGSATTVTVYGAYNGVSGSKSIPLTVTGSGSAATCASASGMSLDGAVGVSAVTINGCPGYFVADKEGRVAAFGSATTHGDLSQFHLNTPIVGITATADGEGYYMFSAAGGVFTFGDAASHFYGSAAQYHPATPLVGMAVKPDGSGYWMVTAAGGMFTFGSAQFYGSASSYHPATPVAGMAVAPNGNGYWEVTQRGGLFAFNAPYVGSLGNGPPPPYPIVGVSGTPSGKGYTLVSTHGNVYTFNAPNYGQPAHATNIVDLSPTPSDSGYYLVNAYGGIYNYGTGVKYFGGV